MPSNIYRIYQDLNTYIDIQADIAHGDTENLILYSDSGQVIGWFMMRDIYGWARHVVEAEKQDLTLAQKICAVFD